MPERRDHQLPVRSEDGSNLTEFSAGIFKQSMGARNRVGIGLSYRPARLHSLDELESTLGLLKSLKIRAQMREGGPHSSQPERPRR